MTMMANMDPIIRLSGVTKRYGSGTATTTALQDLDLTVLHGQFVSVMGASGSGKTTLLNIIAGLDVADSGRRVVDGQELDLLPDHRLADFRLRTIGFIFQAFNLIPALTVEQNVACPLRFSGCARAAIRPSTLDALQRVGVAGRERRYPAELSAGEQQRVAIARAIVTQPRILLADEPTGNLDSQTGRLILDLLRTLNSSNGVTIVMVTHSVFAAAYGDRSLEMSDGRIVRDARAPAIDAEAPETGPAS